MDSQQPVGGSSTRHQGGHPVQGSLDKGVILRSKGQPQPLVEPQDRHLLPVCTSGHLG